MKEGDIVEFKEDFGEVEKGTVAKIDFITPTAIFVKRVHSSGYWVTEKISREDAEILVETDKKLNG